MENSELSKNFKDKDKPEVEAGIEEDVEIKADDIDLDAGSYDAGETDIESDDADSEDKSDDADNEDIMEKKEKVKLPRLDHAYDGLLSVSLLAALIGALLGLIPATLIAYLTGIVFYPLFIAAPLLAYVFNSLLKGGRDIRAWIAAAVFSLASAYMTALACHEALYTATHNLPIIQILLRTVIAIGDPGVIPSSASAYIYPLVFTACGLAVIWELFRGTRLRNAGSEMEINEPETGDEAEDETETLADIEIEEKTEIDVE